MMKKEENDAADQNKRRFGRFTQTKDALKYK